MGRGEYALVLVALFVLGLIAELIRPGLSGSLKTLWAEDGGVVLEGALTQGFPHVLTIVYPEYLIVVPRLIGQVATWFPLRDAAVVIAILSSAVIVLSGFVVWFASAGQLRNPVLRGTFAVVVVLSPVASLEAVASAAFVSWYMLVASFWILFFRPRTDLGAVAVSLFLLATAISNPGVWFFAPIAGLRLLAIRDRRDAAIVAAYTVGSGIQVIASIGHSSEVPAHWFGDVWTVYLQRVLDGSVLGLRWGGDLWGTLGWPLLIGLLVAAVIGIATGLRRASAPARAAAIAAIATSALTFFVSMYQRAAPPALIWQPGSHIELGGRYAIVPASLLLAAGLILVDDHLAGVSRGRPRAAILGIAVLVPLIAVGSSFYLQENVARGSTHWAPSVDAGVRHCEETGQTKITIQTAPPGFGVVLPCSTLSSNLPAKPDPGTP